MGAGIKITLAVLLLSIGLGILKISSFLEVPPVPEIEETWWGVGNPSTQDKAITPFKINVPDEVLRDLNYRLKTSKFPQPLDGALHTYGLNSKVASKINDFWLNKYNWREREKYLNQYPQFKTNIQGLNIHFLHVKPKEAKGLNVIPLLIMHGWPGSVREFYEIIPLLTTPQKNRNVVYEVIAPSLPGYGFSDGAVRQGLGPAQVAVIMKNLMKRLNFDKFYVHGGDWGGMIASHMSILFPNNVMAMHSNMCAAMSPLKLFLYSFKPSLIVEEKYQHLVYPVSNVFWKLIQESGYMHIQATKPDTVAIALSNSPIGLATYILEKFITWTNPEWIHVADGGLTQKYKLEDLLDNVMIYWITDSITTSMRLYAENFNHKNYGLHLDRIPVKIPAGCARFIHDILYVPTAILEDKYPKLLHVTDHDGGHFAAFEVPQVLAKDIYDFTEKVLMMEEKH